MQTVADGHEFGPITDKLVRDLLNAGARLTAQVTQNPHELGPRLHAYTVEITTALGRWTRIPAVSARRAAIASTTSLTG